MNTTQGPAAATIFCDGACSGNPGPGGWAAIVQIDGAEHELSGAQEHTTNNVMEMMAAIKGLKSLKQPSRVTLVSDSQYLIKGMAEWLDGWKQRGWRKGNGDAVQNQNLWMVLDELNRRHRITWKWIRGHHGHRENERCDALARKAIDDLRRGGGI